MARLILLLLLLPIFALAQTGVITGKVSATDAKAPLARANVFLSNSSSGTSTAADGTFTLKGLKPGQYTLVVTTVGYEDNSQVIVINNNAINLNIELAPKTIQLREVNISTLSKADRRLALDRFKNEFIGEDANANDCKIINPDVLNLSFRQNKNILNVFTDDFLIVENHALGYRIKFQIKDFKSDRVTGKIEYKGERFFEELNGKESQKKKWYKKRDEAYFGSPMHFYRSLYKDSLASAGFKIYRFTRELNHDRPSDVIIQQKLDQYKNDMDSVGFWTNVRALPRYTKQTVATNQLDIKDILRKTDQPGLRAIIFSDYLYIIYTNKWETTYLKDIYRAPNNLNYPTSVISIVNGNRYVAFDSNGTTLAGTGPFYEGSWATARLSTMLPVDFTPYGKPKFN